MLRKAATAILGMSLNAKMLSRHDRTAAKAATMSVSLAAAVVNN